jgi:hypothetical protein
MGTSPMLGGPPNAHLSEITTRAEEIFTHFARLARLRKSSIAPTVANTPIPKHDLPTSPARASCKVAPRLDAFASCSGGGTASSIPASDCRYGHVQPESIFRRFHHEHLKPRGNLSCVYHGLKHGACAKEATPHNKLCLQAICCRKMHLL